MPTTTATDLSPDALSEAAECLRTIAHPQRLRLIALLLDGGYTVGELAEACGLRSHVASEHLRLMQRCGLLDATRDGRRTYYRVTEPCLATILDCLGRRFGGPGERTPR